MEENEGKSTLFIHHIPQRFTFLDRRNGSVPEETISFENSKERDTLKADIRMILFGTKIDPVVLHTLNWKRYTSGYRYELTPSDYDKMFIEIESVIAYSRDNIPLILNASKNVHIKKLLKGGSKRKSKKRKIKSRRYKRSYKKLK